MELRSTQTGRAAEYLCCYLLELNGIEAHHLNSTTDILAVVPSGRVVRLEVKASNTPAHKKSGDKYRFLARNAGRSDWYVFVALDIQLMIFMPSAEVKNKTITIDGSAFTELAQSSTLSAMAGAQ